MALSPTELSSDKLNSRPGIIRNVRSLYPLQNLREDLIIVVQPRDICAPDKLGPNSLFDVCEAVAASCKHLRWGHFSPISTAQEIVLMSQFNKAL